MSIIQQNCKGHNETAQDDDNRIEEQNREKMDDDRENLRKIE